ncbi:hypothetical protein [Microbacterium sp. CFBP9034]|uniref:hypothetical protein n=1 Tax=Microbacterium sp. CFBP9034 TaxID=3096540 RepID=UPI002A6B5922|nr:hypothetical protein [Microbacterium sp. CFBP9034]MDY0909511.1 hypothetical protein [Microbacterium sp. CFBP9034]
MRPHHLSDRATEDPAGILVLQGRPLRPGITLEETARFGDDEWPMGPGVLQTQQRNLNLRFDSVGEEYRHVLKLFTYTALSGPLPPSEARLSLSSVYATFYNVAVFLRWLDINHGGRPISLITADTLLMYQRHLLTAHRSPQRRHALRAAVTFLWRYRQPLGTEALRLDPRRIPGWREQGARPSENTTARIPEAVHSRTLVWAMRFVNDFADDIITAVTTWEKLRRPRPPSRNARHVNDASITDYLANAHADGKPLPGFNGRVNHAAIARTIGCNRRAVDDHAVKFADAARELGVSDFVYLDVNVKGRIDGNPWIDGVTLDPARDDSLAVLTQMLQAACYITVAFLSGMRDSEVKHLRNGCSTTHLDGNGRPYRWTVTGLAFKGEDDPAGVAATWVIGAPAAQAISVLERVQAHSHNRTDWLFAPIKTGPGIGSAGRHGNKTMTNAGSNRQLNRFITWVNDYCRARGLRDSIPYVDGKPWRLSTRQFRRTLAWYIARKPGGSIAGAIAYRHHSIQMFEGYAGTSDSGFRAEVEAEQALTRGEDLLAAIDRNEHTNLTGPAAQEAEQRLQKMGRDARFGGTVTTDRQRFLRLITVNAPAVYPGKYVTCVYTHSKALCRDQNQTTDSTPDLGNCKPLACKNVALTEANRATWQAELTSIETELKSTPLLPPLLIAKLQDRQRQITQLLDRDGTPA